MTPTEELRTRLRKLVDERIPFGGTAADTRFSDEDLDEFLTESGTINQAAAEAWENKAARAFSEQGGMTETTVKDETFKFVDPKKFKEHCRDMAQFYRDRDATPVAGNGSRIFGYDVG